MKGRKEGKRYRLVHRRRSGNPMGSAHILIKRSADLSPVHVVGFSKDYFGILNVHLISTCLEIFSLNSFTPVFLKWALPSLNSDTATVADWDFCQNSKSEVANSVDPDKTARTSRLILIYTVCKIFLLVCRGERVIGTSIYKFSCQ